MSTTHAGNIGDVLRFHCDEGNTSRREIAENAGVSVSTATRWEDNVYPPSTWELRAVIAAFIRAGRWEVAGSLISSYLGDLISFQPLDIADHEFDCNGDGKTDVADQAQDALEVDEQISTLAKSLVVRPGGGKMLSSFESEEHHTTLLGIQRLVARQLARRSRITLRPAMA